MLNYTSETPNALPLNSTAPALPSQPCYGDIYNDRYRQRQQYPYIQQTQQTPHQQLHRHEQHRQTPRPQQQQRYQTPYPPQSISPTREYVRCTETPSAVLSQNLPQPEIGYRYRIPVDLADATVNLPSTQVRQDRNIRPDFEFQHKGGSLNFDYNIADQYK